MFIEISRHNAHASRNQKEIIKQYGSNPVNIRFYRSIPMLQYLYIESMGVDVEFLNATLKEDAYNYPQAQYLTVAKGLVLKLKKALYGLKQTSKERKETMDTILREESR